MKEKVDRYLVKEWMLPAVAFIIGEAKVDDVLQAMEEGERRQIIFINEEKTPIGLLDSEKFYRHLLKDKSPKKKVKESWLNDVEPLSEDESILHVKDLPSPVQDKQGNLTGVLDWEDVARAYRGFAEDWKNDTEVSELILNSAYEGIAVVDQDGILVQMNTAYRNFLGMSEDSEIIGRPVEEVIENTRLHKTVESGLPEKGEIQVIQGQKMVVHRIPIRKGGRVTGAIGMLIFEGVSELYRILGNAANMELAPPFKNEDRKKIEEDGRLYTFEQLIGDSSPLLDSKSKARKAARTKATVLLTGESGTGKELFAQSIHQMSERTGAFISVNCAAIPEHLLEAELFGYEEGAFTGAKRGGSTGKFEAANYGTLFLDEISTMTMAMQAKILRILEEREVVRVGGHARIPLQVRIIAATNEDLIGLVESGRFREDLLYRLHVIPIHVPPLRERTSDIPLLFQHYMQYFAEENDLPPKELQQEALEMLMDYEWPGNIRELMNIAEQIMILSDHYTISASDLPPLIRRQANQPEETNKTPLREEQCRREKQMIMTAIEEHRGNKTKAAQALGIHRTTLYKKIKEHQVPEYL
ncbi:sigma 54-interacting transcriptional regulator [Alteribacillus sp. HJP-4]|uniref:sigma 54-interacting transcriptional regulator n=1 Tax=Alteribacillus sp. HJP-4 TaxID=2775394 RepID=UPI0035CD3117